MIARNVEIIISGNEKIATFVSEDGVINTVQDATDLLGNAYHRGAEYIILQEKNLNPAFFDLKTGIAGEVLQKFSNYGIKLAIIGEFDTFNSKALNAFIRECNRGNTIFFVPDFDSAIKKML